MKKLLAIVLSAVMVFAFAAVSMAATITTTGEIDVEANYENNSQLTEIGLYNNIDISKSVSAYIGFWLETDEGNPQTYNIIDDAYGTFKLGNTSLKLGYGRYNIDGPLDALGNGHFLMNAMGGSLEPDVEVLWTVPVTNSLTANVGYFPNWGATTSDASGHDTIPVQLTYKAGALTVDGTYLYLSKGDSADAPDSEYIVDAAYKLGENGKVYATYAGVDQAKATEDLVNFGFVGAQYNVGKLFIEGEYAVSVPDDVKDGNPFGAIISYQFDPNAKIQYTRWSNSEYINNNAERNRLEVDITF